MHPCISVGEFQRVTIFFCLLQKREFSTPSSKMGRTPRVAPDSSRKQGASKSVSKSSTPSGKNAALAAARYI